MSDLLYETPGNPVPPDTTAGMMRARDGRHIRYALFPAEGRPQKGTVVLVQGRNECIEKYYETARNLSARGLGLATFDLRGQGDSDRMLRDPQRGYVRNFNQYVTDLEQFFEEVVLPDCRGPYYILGHSTGSLVCLLAAPRMFNRVQRMVLVAPYLGLAGVSMTSLRRVSLLMRLVGLGRMYMSGGPRKPGGTPFEKNVLTSDPERYARNQTIYNEHPELALGGPTATWINASCRASKAVHRDEFLAALQVPILMVAAGHDEVVSSRMIEDYARHMRLGSVVTIDGARHEILQERDIFREQFWAAFDAFVPGTDTLTRAVVEAGQTESSSRAAA